MLLVLQIESGGTTYHFTDYAKNLYRLHIHFYDCDNNDNVYATCLDSWLLEKYSPCLGHRQRFSGYQSSLGNIINLKIAGDLLAIECEEFYGNPDNLECNPILLFSLSEEQLVKTFRVDDYFIYQPIHFCLNTSAELFIQNSYGNKLVVCSLEGSNENYIVSEDDSFNQRYPPVPISTHVLRGIRIHAHNQLIRCFPQGVLRITDFNSLVTNH